MIGLSGKMMETLISVIIPIYKCEKYLEQCVRSVLSQTYSNLEILLIDDGSPDSCPQICDAFAEKDKRIKVFHKINGGVSSARNMGLDHATGSYICFVDSDDILPENAVSDLVRGITDNHCQYAAGICGILNSGKVKNSIHKKRLLTMRRVLRSCYIILRKVVHILRMQKYTMPV